LFDPVDHQRLDGTFGRFEPQPKLFLYCRKESRSVRIRRRRCAGPLRKRPKGSAALSYVRRPLELEIVIALEPGLIHDDAPSLIGKLRREHLQSSLLER